MRRGFRGHGFDRNWSEDGERKRGRKIFDGEELRLVLLKLLKDEPRHGYDLIRAIEELTSGAYAPSPGVVYPTLTLLSEMGHTREVSSDNTRKAYEVTEEGTAFLTAREKDVEALFERLKELAAVRERFDGAPIRRAMGNLRAVLMHKLGEGKADAKAVHAVTAIIDEAAQKIERL
jgi:DNA-binding PadR family transcriptional regulator